MLKTLWRLFRHAVPLAMAVALTLAGSYAWGGAEAENRTEEPSLTAPDAVASVPGVPRYEIFFGPPYANGNGEPSIGVNWDTGSVMYQWGFVTAKVTYDDCASPSVATWTNKSVPTNTASLDPILFTDPQTGRTFASQLNGACSFTSFTDDDGENWTPSEGCGPPAGADHQTIGGGPFHAGPTDCHTELYPNAVYYCSQFGVQPGPATCAMSCDGGLNFGPGVPAWTTQCGGIHGHLKVAPDGTVYVPNRNCGGRVGVALSEDNGLNWTVRVALPTTSPLNGYLVDPSLGIDETGRLYLGYQRSDGRAYVVTSDDKGVTWRNNQDVGAALGLQNSTFPAVVAGSNGRAAMAFLGTTTPGSFSNVGFLGVWHLYVATTFDAGVTWTTVDATPNDPVQRGSICVQGTTTCCTPGSAGCSRTIADRNLLDFNDVTIDKFGRVLAAYTDGCITSACINGGPNDYTFAAHIARQSGGKRLIAAYDPNPAEPAPPAAPRLDAYRSAPGVAHLAWTSPDDGGSPITGYNIYRGLTSGSETFLAGIGVQNTYDDITADAGTTYYYQVRAVNVPGTGGACGEKIVPGDFTPPPNPCTRPGVRASLDAGDAAPNQPPDPAVDIHSAYVAEPDFGTGINRLVFTMFVGAGPAPSSSQWYIIWNRPVTTNPDRNYVAMKTDALGTISYEYGRVASASANPPTVPTRLGPADFGSFDPVSGKIEIHIANTKVDGVGAGSLLNSFSPRTFYSRPDGAPVTQSTCTDFSEPGAYTLVGNFFCRPNPLPFAILKTSETTGCAPLTVDFDASASYDQDPSNGITTYTFDFGDGGGSVAQSTPTISHTYNSYGAYQARLVVTDGRGGVSQNFASAVIEIEPVPTAVAAGSATICQGSSTVLSGSGGASCAWSPPTGLSNPASCTPTASPTEHTTYSLTVTSANGCVSENSATAIVTVQPTVVSEVSPLNWAGASKDTLSWPALPNAASYRVYRGVEAGLPSLLNSSADSCLRLEGAATTTGPVLTESPAAEAGRLYWYLIVGVGCAGDGPAGNATAGPRILSSSGDCP